MTSVREFGNLCPPFTPILKRFRHLQSSSSQDLLTGRGKQPELIDVFDKDCLSINLNQTHINQIMKDSRQGFWREIEL